MYWLAVGAAEAVRLEQGCASVPWCQSHLRVLCVDQCEQSSNVQGCVLIVAGAAVFAM
jgi:hypothetical protein